MNTRNLNVVPFLKEKRRRDYTFIFEDYELAFEKVQLREITDDRNRGMSIEALRDKHKRHEVEILLALIYQSTKNKIKRPFAYRSEET